MADQGKWFKLWESSLDDQELENLDLDNWARWARLGAYFKKHGTDGILIINPPGRALQTLLRVGDFEAVIRVVKVLPGYAIEESTSAPSHVTLASVPLKITFKNWSKYQGDYSTERTRRWRAKKTSHVTRQEERRGEETESPSPTGSSPAKSALRAAGPLRGAAPLPARSGERHGNGALRAPSQAPPKPSVLEADEHQEYGHNDFLAIGWRSPAMPKDSFQWEALERSLSQIERVQSNQREKLYRAQASARNGDSDDVF